MIKNDSYTLRNLQGFEGDTYMKDKFQEIITRKKIDLIIETGTYLGGTTRQLSDMVQDVITIEVNQENYNYAQATIEGKKNIESHLGNSPEILFKVLNRPKMVNKKIFCFLDAHWGNVCPLKAELKVIAESGLRPVIAIHDFMVPGTDFGYDSYNGQPFTFSWIREDLDAVYGKGKYIAYYNDKATGAKRGILYCEPQ